MEPRMIMVPSMAKVSLLLICLSKVVVMKATAALAPR